MFLHKNVGFFSQLPILYFQQVTVIPTITYQNDPYLNYVVLNINGDTALSGNNNTFLDSGFRNISLSGNVTQGTFSPFSPAGWSGYFNGSSYLTIPDNSTWDVGGDYTLEFWFNCTGDSDLNSSTVRDACLISQTVNGSNGWSILLRGSSNTTGTGISFTVNGPNVVLATMSFLKNVWYHFALVTNGATATIYVNGTNVSSAAYTTTTNLNALLSIGRLLNLSGYANYFIGYISNLRIIKGTALYTSNFTPNSAEPLKLLPNTSLLTLQDNRFVDNSRNNFTLSVTGTPQIQPFSPIAPAVDYTPSLHGGSAYFDGNSRLNALSSNAFLFDDDLTIEAWIYITTTVPVSGMSIYGTAGLGGDDHLTITSSRQVYYGGFTTTQTLINLNRWHHVATVRNSTTLKIYVDGIEVGTTTKSGNIGSSSVGPAIGNRAGDNATPFTGYISNLRVIKGQAVYTSNFTPPSRPVTATSNGGASVGTTAVPNLSVTPSLLLDFDNGGIIDRSYKNEALVFADAKTQTLSSKFGTGSLYFDGTGDYLKIPTNPNLALGNGNFTIEFWINRVGNNVSQHILDWRTANASQVRPTIYINSSNNIIYHTGATDRISNSISLNSWNHVAIVKNSSTTLMFINGVSALTAYTDSNTYLEPTSGLNIGINPEPNGPFNGYLEDIRITRGVARYTTNNFTPPPKLQANNSDPYYSNVVLFLDGNNIGSNVNNEFRATAGDAARLAITRTNATQGSFSPFSPNGWSGYFNGSSYLTVPANSEFNLSGDFTIECCVNTSVSGADGGYTRHIMALGTGADNSNLMKIGLITTGGNPSNVISIYTTTTILLGTIIVADGKWHHIAITRSGSNLRLYVDGVQSGSTTTTSESFSAGATTNINIGKRNQLEAGRWNGYISNLRIVKGLAIYTSNFTPPTGPLPVLSGSGFSTSLLTLQDNIFKDNSPNNFTISVTGTPSVEAFNPYKQTTDYLSTVHGGSVYFNGSSYLEIPSNSVLAFPNGTDFTIECWINFSVLGNNRFYSTNGGVILYFPNGVATFGVYGGTILLTSTVTLTVNRWYHIAITRSGTVLRMFINGVQNVSNNNNTTSFAQNNVRIGADFTTPIPITMTGYASNLRVVKGRAIYTSTFTPPTSPVTAVNGTSLLLNFNNGYAIDSTGNNVITTVGDSRTDVLSTAPLSSSTGSLYFDGTGDYLTIPTNPNLALGTGDFTIEFWINRVGTTTQQIINFGTGVRPAIYYNINRLSYFTTNERLTANLSQNSWNHVAVVRRSSVTIMFVNGVSGAASYSDTNDYVSPVSVLAIGADTTNSNPFNGYLDDIRITKGVARYTSNFTPQTYKNPISNILTYPTDPFRNLVVLDLNADAVNNEQNNTFLDKSGNNSTITRSGSTTQGSFSPFSPAGWSGYFNGNSRLNALSSNAFLFNGDLTIEAWIYITTTVPVSGMSIYGTAGLGGDDHLTITSSRQIYYAGFTTTQTPINLNRWHHVAAIRNSTNLKIYVDGIEVGSTTKSGNIGSSSVGPAIGNRTGDNATPFTGYISNLRVVKGQALYTNTFTPLTAALTTTSTVSGVTLSAENVSLLTLQDNRFKDNSNNNFTISATGTPSVKPFSPFQPTATYSPTVHGGSGYFNGSNFIELRNDLTKYYISSGINTIECFIYKTTNQKSVIFGQTQNNANPYNGWLLNTIANSNLLQFQANLNVINSTIPVPLNEWVHIAVVRVSNNVTLYINGKIAGSGTIAITDFNTNFTIGTYSSTLKTDYFIGYISNFRFVKGVAITPPVGGPTSLVQAVSGTSLLLNFDNAGVVDSTGKNNVTTFSGAKVDYSNKVYGSGALKFNGTSDYMQVGTASDWTFLHIPSAKWTIEFWVYKNSTGSDNIIIDTSNYSSSNIGISILKTSTETLQAFVYLGTAGLAVLSGTSSNTIPLSTWTHVALTYDHSLNSNNMVMYFNGLSSNVFTKTVNPASTSNPANGLSIGCNGNGIARFFNGSIDELRITNEVRYTGNFTISSYTLPLSS